MSTFADPEVIRLARAYFLPVAGDDWYQRRRQDPEGEFFRAVANQGSRGSGSRQGIYVLTAGGRLLVFRNHRDPGVMRLLLREGLAEWSRLPAAERKAGAFEVPPLEQADPRFSRTPPRGGLIVNVNTRILDHDRGGGLCRGTCRTRGGGLSAHDHLWVTEVEWRALVPVNLRQGDSFALPERLARRLARFHLVDNTRGEPLAWSRDEVRTCDLKIIVEAADASGVRLRLQGSVLLETGHAAGRGQRGYDVSLFGYIHYDADKRTMDRFDVVAVGEHWGEGPFTPGARPGRMPLGVAFTLARGDTAADRVPPQGNRDLDHYLQAER